MEDYKKYEPIFGSWYISKPIGKGSFGTVYEIIREEYGTTYKAALKVITVPQDDEDIKARMTIAGDAETLSEYYEEILKEIINENEIMSKLKGNSNIVSYEDHQIIPHEDGIGYDILIRMELLTPLLDRMIDKKLEEKDVVKLGIDICKALELCHKKNIIHRDIKPQNIFISDSGDYKLGDFGIARTMEKTTDGMSKKGTYRYMAPEVFRGEDYNSTVDIYSLGIVLYTLLNGNRGPFLPPPPEKITHNDEEEARIRRFKGEELPDPQDAGKMLALIIRKASNADPAKRYSSAKQMRRDLESYYENTYSQNSKAKPILAEEKPLYAAAAPVQQMAENGQRKNIALNNYPSGRNPHAAIPAASASMQAGFKGFGNKGKTLAVAAILGILVLSLLIGGMAALKNRGGDKTADKGAQRRTENSGEVAGTSVNAGMQEIAETDGIKITNFEYDWDSARTDSISGIYTVDTIYRVTNESGRDIVGISYEAKSPAGEQIVAETDDKSKLSAFGYIPSGKSGVMVGELACNRNQLKPDGDSFKITGAYVNDAIQNYSVPSGRIAEHVGAGDYYNVLVSNNNDMEISKNSKVVAIDYSDGVIEEADATGMLRGPIPPNEENYVIKEAFINPNFNADNNEDMRIYIIDVDYYKNAGL